MRQKLDNVNIKCQYFCACLLALGRAVFKMSNSEYNFF